jgi:hypothetical protein
MDTERRTDAEAADSIDSIATRRAVLAAGGAVALGALAGCTALDEIRDQASDQAVRTGMASPASFYTGGEAGDVTAYRGDPVDVRFVPPTLQADSRRIEIDGWSTSAPTRPEDYNTPRSNRSIWWPAPTTRTPTATVSRRS